MKLNSVILMRPDFTNTEYMNALQQEWQSHDFSTGILQAVAQKTSQTLGEDSAPEIAKANADFVQPSGPVASREEHILGE
jgi:hypothetical protein